VLVDCAAAAFVSLVSGAFAVVVLVVGVFAVVGFVVLDFGAAELGEGDPVDESVATCLPLGAAVDEDFDFGVGVSGVVTSGDPFDDRQCPV